VRAGLLVLWSGLFAGCYSPDPPFGVPCSDTHECPQGQECDLLTNICGFPTEARTLRDDTFDQFTGGALEGALIEKGGFVGPIPYFIGGVRATGIEGNRLEDDVDATTFDDLAQITPTGRGVLRGVDIALGDEIPALLGFSDGDDITVLVEGEIYLDTMGTYMFELRANDIGFVDLAPPGGAFQRVGSAGTSPQSYSFTAPSPGWYRFRGALADSSEFLEWELRYRIPNVGGIRSIPDNQIRAAVDGLDGAIVDAFEEGYLSLYTGTGLTDRLDGLNFAMPPYGFGTGGAAYSLRWTAQFLVDIEGDFRFSLDSTQGQRMWIDGAQATNAWDGASHVITTMPLHLEAGWHDVVFDTTKTNGTNGKYSLTVFDGPQFAGAGIPQDHLRPVSGRAARFNTASNTAITDITDGMTITRNVGLDLPAGFTPVAIDTQFQVTHPLLPQITMTLDPPAGANITLVAANDLVGTGNYTRHDVIPTDRAGTSFNFIAGDSTVDAMMGTVEFANVTVVYTGGRQPYEPAATYTSTVRDLDMARFGPLTWAMRQAKVEPMVSVRTCDEMAACDAEAWSGVTNGATPTAPARKYFQYKVEIMSELDVPTSLDWIDLQYVGYVEP